MTFATTTNVATNRRSMLAIILKDENDVDIAKALSGSTEMEDATMEMLIDHLKFDKQIREADKAFEEMMKEN